MRLLVEAGREPSIDGRGAEIYLPLHRALVVLPQSIRYSLCEQGEEPLPAGAVSVLPESVAVSLPQNLSCAGVEFEARRQFLHRSAHAHDASRGTDLPPAVALIYNDVGESLLVFSDWGLDTPPLPDFSMPFNVVAICSSAMAFLMGSFLNLIFKAGLRDINA